MEITGSTRWSGLHEWRVCAQELSCMRLTTILGFFEALLLGLWVRLSDVRIGIVDRAKESGSRIVLSIPKCLRLASRLFLLSLVY